MCKYRWLGVQSPVNIDLPRSIVDVIIATRDVLENPVLSAESALEAATALQTSLSEQADLQIPTVALCTRVQTFGVYDEMPAAALVPGQVLRDSE